MKDSIAETILKASRTSLLSYYLTSRGQNIKQNWQVVKTTLKYHYKIEDYKIWEYYIDLLRFFKKDLSTEMLACPENLNEAHDRLVTKKRKVQRKKHLLEIRSEMREAQQIYAKQKKPFFGLCFSKENLSISVIETVKDFMDQGDALHNCIFTNV